ncbi:MAG: hypothetical protein IPL32_09955 [Chloracidobacterium sp.]|nr:hypothetical protein [Chloracidobacterium sp.]
MKAILVAVGLVVGLVIGITLGAIAMHFLYSPIFGETPMNFQTIYFPNINRKIYTVARVWGITGDHEEVRLCSEPYEFGKRDQTDQCVVFHTERIFYKKDGASGLIVFAPSFSISPTNKEMIGPIKISTKSLKNFEEINDYEQNFENYGLMTIAAP